MFQLALNEALSRERMREVMNDERVRQEYVRRKAILRRRQRRVDAARRALQSLSL